MKVIIVYLVSDSLRTKLNCEMRDGVSDGCNSDGVSDGGSHQEASKSCSIVYV